MALGENRDARSESVDTSSPDILSLFNKLVASALGSQHIDVQRSGSHIVGSGGDAIRLLAKSVV